nr:ASN_HP1_G0050710.mRNA.1.CDS.1 [Saccharomyces cerevisiae]
MIDILLSDIRFGNGQLTEVRMALKKSCKERPALRKSLEDLLKENATLALSYKEITVSNDQSERKRTIANQNIRC